MNDADMRETIQLKLDELLVMAETKLEGLKGLYEKSDLQERPDEDKAQQILTEIRETFYGSI